MFQNQCDKWIKNPTWTSAKHEVEPKCLTLLCNHGKWCGIVRNDKYWYGIVGTAYAHACACACEQKSACLCASARVFTCAFASVCAHVFLHMYLHMDMHVHVY